MDAIKNIIQNLKLKISKEKIITSIYWVMVIIIFMFLLRDIISKIIISFEHTSLTFAVDTLYLDWNTSFVSVSVCQLFNGEKTWELSQMYFGEDRDTRIDDIIIDIAFFSGTCYSCDTCLAEDICPLNYTEIIYKFRSRCETMILNCSWNNEPFECCDIFLPLKTEFGTCYTINSVNTNPRYGKRLISNRLNGPGTLKLSVTEDIDIHFHSPDDVPFAFEERELKDSILWGSVKTYIIKIIETVNDPSVADLSVPERKCRFPWENDDIHLYNHYSFSACAVQCYEAAQLHFCNCTHHLMPKNKEGPISSCNYEGLMCITDHFLEISQLRKTCDCVSSCVEPEYNMVYKSMEEFQGSPGTEISISMLNLPSHRYIRKIVKTKMDLITSIGGIIGLFFGASFLSSIDMLYSSVRMVIRSVYHHMREYCLLKKAKKMQQRLFSLFKDFVMRNQTYTHKKLYNPQKI